MDLTTARRFAVTPGILGAAIALGACAPGPEGTDTDGQALFPEVVVPPTDADAAPTAGAALPTIELSASDVVAGSNPSPEPSVVPDVTAPPSPVATTSPDPVPSPAAVPVVPPLRETSTPDEVVDVPTVAPTPETAPDNVSEPEADAGPAPAATPTEETPSDSPFDVVDGPAPGTEPETAPDTETDAEAPALGEAEPAEGSGAENPDAELPTHDPNGIPYCD